MLRKGVKLLIKKMVDYKKALVAILENINLYEKWFPNATNNEIEDKIVEATISNWFEDEDASSDKVWEYFRVI